MTPLVTMLVEAVRFASWAAGQGLCPVEGEPARAPEDFLFDYSTATGETDWETMADRLPALLAPRQLQPSKLTDAADRFLKWAYKQPYSGPPVISIPRHVDNIDAILIEAASEIERLTDKVEGLNADLYCAVEVAYKRGAVEWTRLNYPELFESFEGLTEEAG